MVMISLSISKAKEDNNKSIYAKVAKGVVTEKYVHMHLLTHFILDS